MVSLEFTTTACNRPAILNRTYNSFTTNMKGIDFKKSILYINVDPTPNSINITKVGQIAKKYFGSVIIHYPPKPNFAKAVIWCFSQVKNKYFFHLEDDWLLLKYVNMNSIINRMEEDKNNHICFFRKMPKMNQRILYTPKLIPGLHRTEITKLFLKKMTTNKNPEAQMKYIYNKLKSQGNCNYKYIPTTRKLVRDIGRDWLRKKNIVRDYAKTSKNNSLRTWSPWITWKIPDNYITQDLQIETNEYKQLIDTINKLNLQIKNLEDIIGKQTNEIKILEGILNFKTTNKNCLVPISNKKITALITHNDIEDNITSTKNIYYDDKPIIYWSIQQALNSKYINEIVVITNNTNIARISKNYGVQVPFIIDNKLSDTDIINRYIDWIRVNELKTMPNLLIHLRSTFPNRQINLIDDCIKEFIEQCINYNCLKVVYDISSLINKARDNIYIETDEQLLKYNNDIKLDNKLYIDSKQVDIYYLNDKCNKFDKIYPYICPYF